MPVPDKVVLHPLVLLSVVDHYGRVAKDTNKRVVGVLLGEEIKGQVDVTNSFAGAQRLDGTMHAGCLHDAGGSRIAVPFEEDENDSAIWFLDHSYLEIMCKMFKKVNGGCDPRPCLHPSGLAFTERSSSPCMLLNLVPLHAQPGRTL